MADDYDDLSRRSFLGATGTTAVPFLSGDECDDGTTTTTTEDNKTADHTTTPHHHHPHDHDHDKKYGDDTRHKKHGDRQLSLSDLELTMYPVCNAPHAYRMGLEYIPQSNTPLALKTWDIYGADETDGDVRIENESSNVSPVTLDGRTPPIIEQTTVYKDLITDSEFIVSEVVDASSDKTYGVFDKDVFVHLKDHEEYFATGDTLIQADSVKDAVRQYQKM